MLTGRSLLLAGRLDEGLSYMDQAMLRVTSGKTSPRMLIAQAFRSLGDDEGARIELEAARATFAQLGARPAWIPLRF